jgi:hypothetical protein
MLINIEYIKKEIAAISTMMDDPEAAHLAEDTLIITVLDYIANHPEIELRNGASELAAEVLKVIDLDFPRWYA